MKIRAVVVEYEDGSTQRIEGDPFDVKKMPLVPAPRCLDCCGTGYLTSSASGFCHCTMGIDLRLATRQSRKPA